MARWCMAFALALPAAGCGTAFNLVSDPPSPYGGVALDASLFGWAALDTSKAPPEYGLAALCLLDAPLTLAGDTASLPLVAALTLRRDLRNQQPEEVVGGAARPLGPESPAE